jgi:hypothetical protein
VFIYNDDVSINNEAAQHVEQTLNTDIHQQYAVFILLITVLRLGFTPIIVLCAFDIVIELNFCKLNHCRK